jgi:RNA recognition motif-containing protein
MTEADFIAAFAEIGVQVRSIKIILDKETQRPKGFGFIEVDDDSAAQAAIASSGTLIGGRPIRIDRASKQPEKSRGGRESRESHDRDWED